MHGGPSAASLWWDVLCTSLPRLREQKKRSKQNQMTRRNVFLSGLSRSPVSLKGAHQVSLQLSTSTICCEYANAHSLMRLAMLASISDKVPLSKSASMLKSKKQRWPLVDSLPPKASLICWISKSSELHVGCSSRAKPQCWHIWTNKQKTALQHRILNKQTLKMFSFDAIMAPHVRVIP